MPISSAAPGGIRLSVPQREAESVGTHLRIEHRFVCFAVERIGRILSWRDGRSYAFSDLSHRPGRGFPHIYVYDVQPEAGGGCRFNILVRGKWTATWLPRPLVRLWLGWVMLKIKQSAHNELLVRAGGEARFVGSVPAVGCRPGRTHPAPARGRRPP